MSEAARLREAITPADLADRMGCSERLVRKMARDLGACRIFGKSMALLPRFASVPVPVVACSGGSSMSWNYRIVRYRDNHGFGLHEVYYDWEGEPWGMTTDPASFVCDADEGPEDVRESLMMAVTDAREQPVLDEFEAWPAMNVLATRLQCLAEDDSVHCPATAKKLCAGAAARIEELEGALRFYRDAWEDDFGFLGTAPCDRMPTDALYEDRGELARAALTKDQGND